VWDGRSGQQLLTLRGHTGAVWGVAFSPDGQRLASASFDQTVKVWDGPSGQELLTLHGHTGAVMSVAFSPDGQRLASASHDGTVQVWDGRSGQELLTLRGHTGQVWGVAFSPDGKMLLGKVVGLQLLAWNANTGTRVPAPRQAVAFTGSQAARHPSLPVLALVVGDQVELIELRPPDEVELGLREFMARFDASWHREAAKASEHQEQWYAAAFHWGQLAEHDPRDTQAWLRLEASCAQFGDWQLALTTCDRLLQRDATLGAVYLRRARLRAHLFQFREATADHLAGLALLARTKRP
jgi:hypothetical protein